MNLDSPGVIIAIAGFLVTWGGFAIRLRQLEKEVSKIEGLQKDVATNDGAARDSAKSQGERLGNVEQEVAILKGKFEGFDRGFGAGRRSRTAAQGIPIRDKAGGE
jgi:hypothetical protein